MPASSLLYRAASAMLGTASMIRFRKSDDYGPVGWIGQYPLHVSTLLVILFCGAMAALALVSPGTRFGVTSALLFRSDAVRGFQFWRFATSAFLNEPSIWFAVDMFLLAWFGREVEKFIGRRAFILLFFVLLLLPPCVLSALGIWVPSVYRGEQVLNFSIFLAFAAIYPGVEFFFGVKVKWLALIFLAIYSLQALSGRDTAELAVLWSSAAGAFLYMDYARGFPTFERFQRAAPRREPPPPPRKVRRAPPPEEEDVMASIDPLLDKISKHGLASLSRAEREKLERVRDVLNKPRGVG